MNPQNEEEISFPDVFMDTLDDDAIVAYFEDLQAHAEVHELRVKGGERAYSTTQEDGLRTCAHDWARHAIYSLQIVYAFDEQVWCDTLQRMKEGTRIVRLKAER